MIDESKIRERAYALWEKDACPEGAALFYWRLAQDQLAAELRSFKAVPLMQSLEQRKAASLNRYPGSRSLGPAKNLLKDRPAENEDLHKAALLGRS
jgi:hypothetical protein